MLHPRFLLIAILTIIKFSSIAQEKFPYQYNTLSIEVRVADLLKRMTPEEKFRQLFMVTSAFETDSVQLHEGLFGFQINTDSLFDNSQKMNAIIQRKNAIQRFFIEQTRLGIPVIFYDEALHGLVRKNATAFPQAIAMAASFDSALMFKVANAIALETQARGIRMILSPVINLATDVRWGRVEETYGEDPLLTTALGIAFIRAFEEKNIITTPKHFAVNHGDGGRDSYPIFLNERLLRETYLKPFKACIKHGARSIMSAYNSYDGRPCSANQFLLTKTLKQDWKFNGFAISDAAATGGANVLHFTATDYEDAGKQSIENGLDIIFQTDFSSYHLFKKPFLNGSVRASAIDSAVTRVLSAKYELGLFDSPYITENDMPTIDMIQHKKLAYEMAVESAVLLQNKNHILPINKDIKRIAIIGADAKEARLGGYSGPGNHPISILDGIQQKVGSNIEVSYAEGCPRVESLFEPIPKDYLFHVNNTDSSTEMYAHGLIGRYFNSMDINSKPTLIRYDDQINFQWTLFGPDPKINFDHFSVVWEGYFIPDENGVYEIGIDGNDGYTFSINDSLMIDRSQDQSYHNSFVSVRFKKDHPIKLKIVYKERSGNSIFKLVWKKENQEASNQKMNEAIQATKASDIAIVVAGIEEGEFHDRSKLSLPGRQEELIQKIAATGTPVVVVLIGGSAITMNNWMNEVDGILDCWYPGEMGGKAVADLLFGDRNPSGKLPITFPKSEGQLPLVYNHFPTGRGDDYNDESGQALFPFGYGLSYTDFAYSDLQLDKTTFSKQEKIKLQFKIKNIGKYDGDEVIQLYAHDEVASVVRPIKELKRFQRIALKAGEEKLVTFALSADMFSLFNESMEEVTEPGLFRIMIGSSSKDIRLRTIFEYK